MARQKSLHLNTIGPATFVLLTACASTHVLAVHENPGCRPTEEIKQQEKPYASYLTSARAKITPYFRKGALDGMRKLNVERLRLKFVSPTHEIVSAMMWSISKDGSVTDLKVICPFGVPEFDETVLASLKKLGRLSPPPPNLLGALELAHVRTDFILQEF